MGSSCLLTPFVMGYRRVPEPFLRVFGRIISIEGTVFLRKSDLRACFFAKYRYLYRD